MKKFHCTAVAAISMACASAFAQPSPPTPEFAVLGGAAVTCTTSTINGNVGLANPGTITNSSCRINGAIEEGTQPAVDAYKNFLGQYATVAAATCDYHNVPLAGAFLPPGVYCYDTAVTVTDGTLTLVGSPTDNWTFRIETKTDPALTGTNFHVVLASGATCNNDVLWWTSTSATLTDSSFAGNILAGTAVTVTRGSVAGQLLAGGIGSDSARTGAVSLTDTTVDFCPVNTPPPVPPLVPVFVIGDLEWHRVGDSVNFWGAQWWKNNPMSGTVSPGASSFKGFATRSELLCGGAWQSLPGNSAPPPASIAEEIAVVVTSSVVKDGPNLSGDIKQVLVVHPDSGYGPNPGHAGFGTVNSLVCTRAP